jgi:cysteine-rich repeat protein
VPAPAGKASPSSKAPPSKKPAPSKTHRRPPECGNGKVEGKETCDDGNRTKLDGCNRKCRVRGGWTCKGSPSRCKQID